MNRIFAILVGLTCFQAWPKEKVAVVDLEFIRDTGETAGVICFDKSGEDCGVWATYYLFKLRVIKRIRGEGIKDSFEAIFGHHALKKENFRNVPVIFTEVENNDLAKYKIVQWGETKKAYCFDRKHKSETGAKHELRCFEK